MTTSWRTLGLDAAWTRRAPSGVALLEGPLHAPRLTLVARDLDEALQGGTRDWLSKPVGGFDALPALLAQLAPLHAAGCDIPLGAEPITSRRACDTELSRAYGARKAAVHSPTAQRPGPLACELREAFAAIGLSVLGAGQVAPVSTTPVAPGHVFEVYPHAAIIELMRLPRRLPYKVARRGKAFAHLPSAERFKWCAVFLDALRGALAQQIAGVNELIPSAQALLRAGTPRREATLKGVEDALDAVVCAWVAHEALAGRTRAYGDATSAIRVPEPPRLARRESRPAAALAAV
ncbi:MAG: hypothetical protein DHS20C15_13200 [Planctomycetota bacterium]|nr:MAG: hypothetical protein DHS20C15_13200 [Planctomycetota bacterium]